MEKIKINLCCGSYVLPGWHNVDVYPEAQICLDLNKNLLPYATNSVDIVACISAINYFTPVRAREIIADVYRVLKVGGIARFAVQDLHILARHYLDGNQIFWREKLADGTDRYPGNTLAEKFNNFFNGFAVGPNHARFVYDFETLSAYFRSAGFELIRQCAFGESEIAEVKLLDNRKEQMFFLEAVKKNASPVEPGELTRILLNRATSLESEGKKEAAWQCLLEAGGNSPESTEVFTRLLKGSMSRGLPEEACKALSTHENALQEGTLPAPELQSIKAEHLNQKTESRWKRTVQKWRLQRVAATINARRNRVLSDEEHLNGCLSWLLHLHSVSTDRGVPAAYYPARRHFAVSYPETTGYIIPTLLAAHAVTGNPRHREAAEKMGQWETDIQLPCGGAGEPLGVFAPHPRIFNTGQVLLGWLALYHACKEDRWLTPALKAGLWISDNLSKDGRWIQNVYQGMRTYKSRVVWALLELYKVTGEKKLREAALLALDWIMRRARPNGWFEQNSLTDPELPWTHLTAYTQVGLCEIVHMNLDFCDNGAILAALEQAGEHLCHAQELCVRQRQSNNEFRLLPGTFSPLWQGGDSWSCITGNAQTAFFLIRLFRLTGKNRYSEGADSLIEDLKQIHLLDGVKDAALYGGLPGSYPFGGGYCADFLPNWGVKFFADSLLARISPDNLYALS